MLTGLRFSTTHRTGSPSKKDKGDHQGLTGGEGESGGHDHSGWWCDEHGVKEGGMQHVAARKVAKGVSGQGRLVQGAQPWRRANVSSATPSLKDKFAADYRAKFWPRRPPRAGWFRNPEFEVISHNHDQKKTKPLRPWHAPHRQLTVAFPPFPGACLLSGMKTGDRSWTSSLNQSVRINPCNSL